MRRRLSALVLTAAAVTAALPATQAQAAGGCSGVADTDCTYARCLVNECFYYECDVYVNPTQIRNAGVCLNPLP